MANLKYYLPILLHGEKGMKKSTTEYEDFPQVWKMGNTLEIVYRDHAEFYQLKERFADSGEDNEGNRKPFDPYNEIDMIKGNGGKRVHGMKTVRIVDFTR